MKKLTLLSACALLAASLFTGCLKPTAKHVTESPTGSALSAANAEDNSKVTAQ